MEPTEYYYGKFRTHFATFWGSLELKGSCSRARAHQRQDFWGGRLRSPISGALRANGSYFSVGDLLARPDHDLPDHLADVPKVDQLDFLCAIFYTVLIDQVMYTHRHDDYQIFQGLTQYPKMDRTIGWARTMMMANPYEVFSDDILGSRGFGEMDVRQGLESWVRFIIADLRRFFGEQVVGTTTWASVRDAMLSDQSCTYGIYGAALQRLLLKDRSD
jgi:hypothetical protein